jgi:signal transduction histidine kinase
LQQAFEAQRRFVANASHELRTPLTLERALVEVALADPNPSIDSLRGTCERVLASSRQQEQLIDALLTLARGQAGLERHEEVDLGELACELLSAAAPRLSGPRLSVHSELAPAVVSGDRALLERLIGNLIDNAIVHNREGGEITIETGTAEGVAHLRVANSGARIPPERVAELTEPFRRLDQERTGPGLGLGLSIVRAIANAHGASLLLEPGAAGGLDARLDFAAVASAGSVLTAV